MIEDLKPYPEYKESGLPWLGEVPVHWEIARGRHLFEIRKRIAGTLGYPVLSVTQQGLRFKDISRGEGQQSQDYSKYQLVKPGEFAMNSMDLITGGVGIATSEGVTSPDYRVFGMRSEDQNDSRFYLLLHRMLYANLAFYSCGQGSAQLGRWRLPRKRFNDFLFPVPPISEQSAIARFLAWATNRLDRAIGAKRRIIALLQEQKQAIIHRAVTRGLNPSAPLKDSCIPWLGAIPEHWEVRPLKHFVPQVTVGIVVQPANLYVSEGVPCLRSLNISSGSIENRPMVFITPESNLLHKKSQLHTGDIVVVRTGRAGVAVVVPQELDGANCIDLLIVRSSTAVDSGYLSTYLNSWGARCDIQFRSVGAIQAHYNTSTLASMRVAMPPKAEQAQLNRHIDNELVSLHSYQHQTEAEITLLREYRTRLIADVVTGKLDVREVAAGLPEEVESSIQSDDAGYDGDEAEDDPGSDPIDTERD